MARLALRFSTISRVTSNSFSFFWLGRWNIRSSISSSRIMRKPRAPTLRAMACRAMARRASSLNFRRTFSNSNRRWYCLIMAFLGRVRISMRANSSRSSNIPTTGRRPTNSGIRPNLIKSSGWISLSSSKLRLRETAASSFSASSPVRKPSDFFPTRLPIIFSRPTNAPPQMNRMLVVSTGVNSWWGCLRPPWGGTLATVPSRILSRACWTPSPETSRDRGVLVLLSDLVDFVDINDPLLGLLDVAVGGLQQFQDNVFNVFTHVPGFGERGGIDNGEGHVKHSGKRLRQQGLTGAGGTNQQDIGLTELDIAGLFVEKNSLVVIVDGNGKLLFGAILADDRANEELFNLRGSG